MVEKNKKYKSIEERVFIDSGISEGLKYFWYGLYAPVAGAFRISTSIRKSMNEQLCTQREDIDTKMERGKDKDICFNLGSGAALLSAFTYALFAEEIPNLSAYSWVVFAATNLASGIYEIGRLRTSRQENLEIKARKEAEKAKDARVATEQK